MISPQSPLPSVNSGTTPLLYDRSLNTTDIKGAQPLKQFVRQEIENRSMLTSDIKGAQPKVNIRALNQPQYDPSNQFKGFDSAMFSTPQGANLSSQNLSQQGQQQQWQVQQQRGEQSPWIPNNYSSKQPYQGISSADPEKNSFYNGPTADRQHKPNNIPQSQIVKEHVLDSANYMQKEINNLPNSPQNNFYLDKYSSYQPGQQSKQTPGAISGEQRTFSNTNIKPRLNSNPSAQFKPLSSQNFREKPIFSEQQYQLPQGYLVSSGQQIKQGTDDFIVEEFKNTAVIRPENFDSKEKYQKFKQSIGNRIISPKHYDVPEKMMQYQMLKDGIYHFQQPKLHLNRENVEKQILSTSAIGGQSSSTPNIFRPNVSGYQPTPAQIQASQQLQSPLSQTTNPQRLISPVVQQQFQMKPETPLNHQLQLQTQQLPIQQYQPTPKQGNIISRVPTSHSRPKSHQEFQPQKLQQIANISNNQLGSPQLSSKLSPKYESIEKNIFSKPLSSERTSPLVSYIKPYHLNPNIDYTTEYITKYNTSSVDQLTKTISPNSSTQPLAKVPWEKKKEEYNLVGNYVQDKRNLPKFQGYNLPVDGYYKQYDGPVIDNMRKDIQDAGKAIPYEVKFKYDMKNKNNQFRNGQPAKSPESQLSQTGISKSFVAGYSDLFRTQHYTIRDPVDPRKFHYSQQTISKNNSKQSQ